MCEARASIDLGLRRAFEEGSVVRLPSASGRMDRNFWAYVASCQQESVTWGGDAVGELPPYQYRIYDPAILFSGGMESTYLAATNPHVRLVSCNNLVAFRDVFDIEIIEHELPGPWIEGSLFAFLAGQGYHCLVSGTERVHTDNYETTVEYERAWGAYSGQTVLSPLRAFYKDEVMMALARAHPALYARAVSCTGNNGQWCGDCPKCWILYHLSRAIDYPLNIPVRNTVDVPDDAYCRAYVDRLRAEYEDYAEKAGLQN